MSAIQSAAPARPTGPTEAGLHRRALGVPSLVFFIVAASAPLTAIAGGQAATYLVTSNRGTAFMFIPLGIVLGLFVVGYAAMSRHVANAGAFYAYVARGLGKVQGVGAAFVALIAYNAMQIGIYGLFGVAMGAFMADKLGITLEWWVWCLIAGAVIGAARRAADRPQRARARGAADPRGARRRAVRLRDPRRPRARRA